MAAGESSGVTQFEFYEGIRIVLPGALTVGLANEVSRTFHLGFRLESDPLGGIAAAILIGLIFYYIDAPAKATVYYQNLPTDLFGKPENTVRRNYKMENLYFVLHDEVVPRSIRARGLYMGSMYRIGLEAIYALMFSSVGVLATATILAVKDWRGIHSAHPSWVPGALGIASSALFVPYSAELERRRRRSGRTIPGEISETVRKQVSALDWTLVLCLVLQIPYILDRRTFLPCALASDFLALVWWAVRYFRGYKTNDGTDSIRRPLGRISAVIAAAIVALFIEFDAVMIVPLRGTITTFEYLEWTAVIMLTLGLICARGHEKRLGGSYATQNTWLSLHKDELQRTYFSGRPPRS